MPVHGGLPLPCPWCTAGATAGWRRHSRPQARLARGASSAHSADRLPARGHVRPWSVPAADEIGDRSAGRWDRWLSGADAEAGSLPAGIAAELALAAAIIYLPPLHLTWATFQP